MYIKNSRHDINFLTTFEKCVTKKSEQFSKKLNYSAMI